MTGIPRRFAKRHWHIVHSGEKLEDFVKPALRFIFRDKQAFTLNHFNPAFGQ